MDNYIRPTKQNQQENHPRPVHVKVSDRSQFYRVTLACGPEISLEELEAVGISYVPCTYEQPIFPFANLWAAKLQVNLDSYTDAHGWNMSGMQGVQIMTGHPTYRPDPNSPDGYQYLTLLDIEARFIERYPNEFETIERLLKESCQSEPCIIESKSGGQHFYFFCDYLAPKISFKDRTDEKMLVEIFSQKGLGRLDDRYRVIEGSILNPPTLPKPALQEIYSHINAIADEIQHPSPDEAPIVEKSRVHDKEILWRSDGRSQYFPLSYCQATTHRDQNRKAVQFFKKNGGVLGRCYNCDSRWYEQAPTRKHILDPAPVPAPSETWEHQQATLEQAFDSDRDTILIRADAGVGKDYAKTSHILQGNIEAEKFVEMITRVNLADEKIASFRQRDTRGFLSMRWKSVFHNWNAHKGKPFHERKTLIDDKDGLMCIQPDKFDTLRSRGLQPQAVLCTTCPVLERCKQRGYRSQPPKARASDYLVSAQDGLLFDRAVTGFTKRIVPDRKRAVTGIVDEVRAHELYSENLLSKVELQQMTETWAGTHAGEFATEMIGALELGTQPDFARIREIITSLRESEQRTITEAFTKIRLIGQVSFEEDDKIVQDDVILASGVFKSGSHEIFIATSKENQARLSSEGIPAVFRSEIDTNVLLLSYPAALNLGIYEIPLEDEIDPNAYPKLHPNPNWTPLHQLQQLFEHYPHIEDTPIHYDGDTFRFYLPPEIHPSIDKIIMMSATAEVKIIASKVFSDRLIEIIDTETAKWEGGNQVFQINSGKYPRASVLDAEGSLNKTGRNLMEVAISEIERSPHKRHAIITYKQIADHYNHAYPQVTFAHYGAAEGENEKFADCDVFWILFDPRIPPHEVKRRAQMIFGRDRIPLNYDYDKEAGVYKDERVQNIAESYAVAELIQAIGRARLVRRSGVQVVIMTGREIPGISGRAETQLFDLNDWKDAGILDNLSATVQNRQDAADKAEKLLQSGMSLRGTAKEANLPYRQVLCISQRLSDPAAAAKRASFSKWCTDQTFRNQILELLASGEKTTKELTQAIEGKRTAIMDELKRLVDAGEIEKPRRGVYCLPEHSTSDSITPARSTGAFAERLTPAVPAVNHNAPEHNQFLPGPLPLSSSETEFQRRVIYWAEGNRDFFEGLSPSDVTHLMQAFPDLFEFEPFVPTGNALDARVRDRGRLLRQENYAILRDPSRQGDSAEAIERSLFYGGDFSLYAVRLAFFLALQNDVGKRWVEAIKSALDFEISRSHLSRYAPRADISVSRIHRYWGEAVDYRKRVVHPIVPFAQHWMYS